MKKNRMYEKARTWNPFKGCYYDCTYCKPSFQLQAKRQKHRCIKCYNYEPHYHPERLNKIPSADIVFVAGNGDISFCDSTYTEQIIESIKTRNKKRPDITYYFQSKKPEYFNGFINKFPENVILVTTLETNRDQDYDKVAKAPVPSDRYNQFKSLNYPRKVVTIEPVIDFDLDVFAKWILDINPEYIWLGYNSKPQSIHLCEPTVEKLNNFIEIISKRIPIKEKDMRKF